MADKVVGQDHFRGWLWKWTNYVKGYQKRWFVLSNGLLSYYKNQAEVSVACRGTIILAGASIVTEDSCHFTISNGSAHRYHLKASSEVERQRWITALELAKSISTEMLDSEESSDCESPPGSARGADGSSVDLASVEERGSQKHHPFKRHDPNLESEKNEIKASLTPLEVKLADLETCNNLIGKHGTTLLSALSDLEAAEKQANNNQMPATLSVSKMKAVNERAMLFRITSSAMISACTEFLQVAKAQSRKWQRLLSHEREQRSRLEETVETLAKQHNSLERALNAGTGPPKTGKIKNQQISHTKSLEDGDEEVVQANTSREYGCSEMSDEDEEFLDAFEDAYEEEIVKEDSTHPDRSDSVSTTSSHESSPPSASQSPVKPDKAAALNSSSNGVQHRTSIPFKPNYRLNLWSIMKNCIGKDLSKIPMPVNFNEPLSMLQRLSENLEYYDILNKAAKCTDSCEQLAHIIAFSVSTYSTTLFRTGKPFNPLLGETFESDRTEEFGYRLISEQVSHHPPTAAMHCESTKNDEHGGWTFWQEFTLSSKFRGKYLSVIPLGMCHLIFHATGHHYTWNRVTTTIHNIIVGKLWVDQHGESVMTNHTTGDYCNVIYSPYSYFSRDTPRKVSGTIVDKHGIERYQVFGTWDATMKCKKLGDPTNAQPLMLWQKYPLPPLAEKMYYFSKLAFILNEWEDDTAPTDSRRRPDQRKMEEGAWDDANQIKVVLEENQRYRRKLRESEEAKRKEQGLPPVPYKPRWFKKVKCPLTNELSYVYINEYWEAKQRQNWDRCPSIFELAPSLEAPVEGSAQYSISQAQTSSSQGRLTPSFNKDQQKAVKDSPVQS